MSIDGSPLAARDSFDPAGRGPTGQWPTGFPAYSTAGDIATNGTNSGLTSALNTAVCSKGCVIEHPGNIASLAVSSRAGSGEIVVRPPIGQRANYSLSSVEIKVDNLLFAGFDGGDGTLLVQGGSNSGFAWTEFNGPGGNFGVYCYHGSTSGGLFYELVYRQYAAMGDIDRGIIRGDGGGTCNVDVRGSILTGTPTPPPAHSDTLQNYNPGGATTLSVRDSVVWPSYDKAFQGEGGDAAMRFNNVFVMSPSYANQLWPGPGSINLGGYFHTTAVAEFRNSTLVGGNHPDLTVSVWDSELFDAGPIVDKGGNTVLTGRPAPPLAPTHEQLNAIWSH